MADGMMARQPVKNPIYLCVMIFDGWFSAQHLFRYGTIRYVLVQVVGHRTNLAYVLYSTYVGTKYILLLTVQYGTYVPTYR